MGAPCAAEEGLQEDLCAWLGSVRGVGAPEARSERGRGLCARRSAECLPSVGWGHGHSPGAESKAL